MHFSIPFMRPVRWSRTFFPSPLLVHVLFFGDHHENNRFNVVRCGAGFSSVPANAVVLDLSTLTCKQFIEGGDDEIKMVLTWMDGWYKGDEDEAIIDTDVFVDNAKKFGAFCAANPTISIVNAAEKILGK
jgi:acid stress chaperone HdeB